jgi:phenylpyruvate tautomerase PptA (4-oxalocrotonate tautomerase family)
VIEELDSRVARLVAEIADTPLDRVATIITEVPAANWGNRRGPGRAGPGGGDR